MNYKSTIPQALLIIAAMLAASLWAWPKVGPIMAVHFGFSGQADGFAPKSIGLLMMPAMALGTSLLFAVMPALMPSNARLERSRGPYNTAWIATLALLLAVHLGMIALALGVALDIRRLVAVALGALFLVLGNLMGKVRYNYVMGIRTPWTLSDERVWDRTHRFAGWAMMLGGLVSMAAGIVAGPDAGPWLFGVVIASVLAPALLAVVYSFRESRRLERA